MRDKRKIKNNINENVFITTFRERYFNSLNEFEVGDKIEYKINNPTSESNDCGNRARIILVLNNEDVIQRIIETYHHIDGLNATFKGFTFDIFKK